MEWTRINQILKSHDVFDYDYSSLPLGEVKYLINRLDNPLSSIVNKISSSQTSNENKEFLLTLYIQERPQFLYLVPKVLQNKAMALAGSRQARSYHGPGVFIDCLNPDIIDKEVKRNLIEQGLLAVFLDEPNNYQDPEYLASLFKALREGFIYQYSNTGEYHSLLQRIDYSFFSQSEVVALIKASHEFFKYIPFNLITDEAILDHVSRYKTTIYIKEKARKHVYQQALKIELLHKNLPAHPQGLVQSIVKLKNPTTLRLIRDFLETLSVDDVVVHAKTEKQLRALAEIYGINASKRFESLTPNSKRALIENDLDL